MVSEGNNTRLALGGKKAGMLHDLLSKDFDMDPATAQYVPKHEGIVKTHQNHPGQELYTFGNVGISIKSRYNGFEVVLHGM
jgi:hypothetical protein